MKNQYGHEVPASWLAEMASSLKRHGYDPRAVEKLAREGMGPEELRDRLRIPAGDMGSLTWTHNIRPLSSKGSSTRLKPWTDAMEVAALKKYYAAKTPRAKHVALKRLQKGRAAAQPQPKFRIGDKVKDIDGRRRGKVSFVGTYDDLLDGFRYKVEEPNGTRLYWNENSMKLVRRGRR